MLAGLIQKSFMLLFSILCIRINTLPVNKATNLFRCMLWTDVISGTAMILCFIAYFAGFSNEIRLPLYVLSQTAENTQVVLGLWLMVLMVLILYGRNATYINIYTALVSSIAIALYYVWADEFATKGTFIYVFAMSILGILTLFKMILTIAAGYELLKLKNLRYGNNSQSNYEVIYRQKYLANELFLFKLYVFLVFDWFVFLPHVLADIPGFVDWYRKVPVKHLTFVLYTSRPMVNYLLLYFYGRIKSERRTGPARENLQEIDDGNHHDAHPSAHITLAVSPPQIPFLAEETRINEHLPLLQGSSNDGLIGLFHSEDDELSNLVRYAQNCRPFNNPIGFLHLGENSIQNDREQVNDKKNSWFFNAFDTDYDDSAI